MSDEGLNVDGSGVLLPGFARSCDGGRSGIGIIHKVVLVA